MPDFTVDLPPLAPGEVIVIPLPTGEYVAPEGWRITGRTLTGVVTATTPRSLTVKERPTVLCGLCGLEITPAAMTISRRGVLNPVAGDPDAHRACYQRAVTVKVSRPGGPADPTVAPPNPPVAPPVVPSA